MSRFFDALREASQVVGLPAEHRPDHDGGIRVEPAGFPGAEPQIDLAAPNLFDSPQAARYDCAGVPADVRIGDAVPVIPHSADPVIVEHYRRLRTKTLQKQAEKPFRTLLITSPGPGEGKTLTTLNLGLSFALLPKFKVLVIDGDLRRGTMGRWLGAEGRPGLGNLLDGSATPDEVILKSTDFPAYFMVRGTSETPAAELLNSPRVGECLRNLGEHFGLVLVDSSPVNLIADTHLLATHCDAILMIARAFVTSRKALEKASQDLSGYRVLGSVLNGGNYIPLYDRYQGYYSGYKGYKGTK
jgi:capsular exopolysaccharide synthesis family protein